MHERQLTHVDAGGRAHMGGTSDKAVTKRSATAQGRVNCSSEAVQRIAADSIAKGNVLDTARLAGIMGAEGTSRSHSSLPSSRAPSCRCRPAASIPPRSPES